MESDVVSGSSRIRLFGYPTVERHGKPLAGPASQRHRLALLALLSLAPNRSLPRDKLIALLWPDADTSAGRHLLNTCVHVIRRATEDALLVSRRDELALSSRVEVDALEFQALLAAGDHEGAVALYTAPLLDAFYLDASTEFEQWAARERDRLASLFRDTLESLAVAAESSGDLTASLRWWRALYHADPYNTRVVVRQMLTLERLGDHGNAIELAREHETLLAKDLEAEAPAEFRSLVQRMRDHPNGMAADAPAVLPDVTAGRKATTATDTAPASLAPASPVSRDPRRRWRRPVLAVAGTAAAAAALMVFARLLTPGPVSTVSIEPFRNLTGDASLDGVGTELRDLIIRDATQWSRIRVIVPERVETRASLIPPLSRRQRPGTVVTGRYSRAGDSVRIDAHIGSSREHRVRRVVTATLPADPLSPLVMQSLAERVLGALAMVVDDRFAAVTSDDHAPPTFMAYQEFVVGLEMHGRADHVPAIDRLRRAVAADSSFTLGMVWLMRALDRSALFRAADSLARALNARTAPLPEADRYAVEWLQARYRGDMQSAYLAARELARLTPGSPWVITYASEATSLRRPNEARQTLDALERRSPWIADWSEFVSSRGAALHLLGRYDEEFVLARRNRHLATNLIARLIAEARPLAAMGRAADIDLLVNEALSTAPQPNLNVGSLLQRIGAELNAHGHRDAAETLFRRSRSWYDAELLNGDRGAMFAWALGNTLTHLGELDSARSVYQRLHERAPRMYRFHGDLAVTSARLGDSSRYAYFDSLLAVPDSTLNIFDRAIRVMYRARAAAAVRDTATALELLQRAVAMGVPEPLDSVHISAELRVLQGRPAFGELTRLRR